VISTRALTGRARTWSSIFLFVRYKERFTTAISIPAPYIGRIPSATYLTHAYTGGETRVYSSVPARFALYSWQFWRKLFAIDWVQVYLTDQRTRIQTMMDCRFLRAHSCEFRCFFATPGSFQSRYTKQQLKMYARYLVFNTETSKRPHLSFDTSCE